MCWFILWVTRLPFYFRIVDVLIRKLKTLCFKLTCRWFNWFVMLALELLHASYCLFSAWLYVIWDRKHNAKRRDEPYPMSTHQQHHDLISLFHISRLSKFFTYLIHIFQRTYMKNKSDFFWDSWEIFFFVGDIDVSEYPP